MTRDNVWHKKMIEKIRGFFIDEGKPGFKISTFQHIFPSSCFSILVSNTHYIFSIFVYALQPLIWKNKVHSLHCTQWKIQSKIHQVFTYNILNVRDIQKGEWRIFPSVWRTKQNHTHTRCATNTRGYSYVTFIYIHMTWLMVLLVAWF